MKRDRAQQLRDMPVAVTLPRRYWLLLETFLVVHEMDWNSTPRACSIADRATAQASFQRQMGIIKNSIIAAERSAAEYLETLEASKREPLSDPKL